MPSKRYLKPISRSLDHNESGEEQKLQSSQPVLRKMNSLVYMRIQNTKVEMDTQRVTMARITDWRFSGLMKLGRTPGGGAKAGPSKFI